MYKKNKEKIIFFKKRNDGFFLRQKLKNDLRSKFGLVVLVLLMDRQKFFIPNGQTF